MKKEFLKISGVKSEKEFYKKYPNEEAFFKAHPNALSQLKKSAEGGPTLDPPFNYNAYLNRANAYLKRAPFEGTALTGTDIANAARDFYNTNGYEYPLDLLLTQAQMETGMGTKLKSNHNYFNVGNFDNGQTQQYASPQESINAYMNLMYNDYLNKGAITPQQLLTNFVNKNGSRYASNPNYEKMIGDQMGYINNYWKKQGLKKGGEAYPQTATMDNFFSYGVPVPPTYYSHGGAFPMAQPESLFFSPNYGTVYNPYNKAMGGSSEAYPQSMSFPYGATGRSTHFMMAEGGQQEELLQQVVAMLQQGAQPQQVIEQLVQTGMSQEDALATVQAVMDKLQQMQGQQPQVQQDPNSEERMVPAEQPAEPPMEQGAEQGAQPMMGFGGQEPNVPLGVNGRLTTFMNSVKNTAAKKINSELGTGKMKKGGASNHMPKFGPGGPYASIDDYIKANPLDPYLLAQFKHDSKYKQAAQDFLANAYRDYYGQTIPVEVNGPNLGGASLRVYGTGINPNASVYTNDPIYEELAKAYGLSVSPSPSNTNNPLANLNINDLTTLATMLTPFGRIKRKSWIDGQFGKGRGNEYMWQTMFNTDNFAEALKQAQASGLNISEQDAGLFGKRKKYIYDWNDPNQPTGSTVTPPGGQGANPQGPGTMSPQDISNLGWLARRRYRKSDYENKLGASGDKYVSTFDPTGNYSGWSEAKNQRIQNKRRRIGEKLDDIYSRAFQTLDSTGQDIFQYNPRLQKKAERLTRRYGKTTEDVPGGIYVDNYTAPKEKQAYGGQLPKAGTGGNHLEEVDSILGQLAAFKNAYGGPDKMQNVLNYTSLAGNMINAMNDASNPLMQYGLAEAMYPGQQVNKGLFNPINGLNTPYGMLPATYDNFAAPSLHGSLSSINAPYPNAAYGGSMNDDSVYMSDDEIANFISMGGQVEFLD